MKRRLDELVGRYDLSEEARLKLEKVLAALAAEPDPPTAISNPREAIDLHLADALSGLELEELRSAASIADLGSGAGFPGLALAAALPHTQVDLVESGRRKCAVIGRLIAAAELSNARPVAARAEEWGVGDGRERYAAVTARALAALPVVLEYAAPLLRGGGALVAWRGARARGEESAAEDAATRLGLSPAEVVRVEPFRGARARHLHVYRKTAPTPEGFPRRPGMAAKRPLGSSRS